LLLLIEVADCTALVEPTGAPGTGNSLKAVKITLQGGSGGCMWLQDLHDDGRIRRGIDGEGKVALVVHRQPVETRESACLRPALPDVIVAHKWAKRSVDGVRDSGFPEVWHGGIEAGIARGGGG